MNSQLESYRLDHDRNVQTIEIQMKVQIVVDLCIGKHAAPHALHDFICTLNDEEMKVALRVVQKALEQK